MLLRTALTGRQERELENWLRSITHHLEQNTWGYEFWLNEDAFQGKVSRCLFYLSLSTTGEEDGWGDNEKQQLQDTLGYLPAQSICISSGCNQEADHATLAQFVLHLAEVYDGWINMQGAICPPLKPLSPETRTWIKERLATPSEQAKARQEYTQKLLRPLIDALPPGKTKIDLWREQYKDPNSPLNEILAEVKAKFGSSIPPEMQTGARDPSLEEIEAYVSSMQGKAYGIEYMTGNNRRWVFHIVNRNFLRGWMNHPRFHMVK